MMKTIIGVALILACGSASLLADELPAATASSPPTLEITASTLTVTSIEPGASVVLFSVAREPVGAIGRVVSRHELLVDADRDAVIRYAPPSGVSPRSIWMVVDLASGGVAVSSPAGTPRLMRPYGAGEGVPAQAVANRLDVGREEVDVLLVRPGTGAWARVVRDGSDADRDGRANGRLHLDSSALRPIDSAFPAAPTALKPGDVLAVLDADRLEYWYGIAPGGGQ